MELEFYLRDAIIVGDELFAVDYEKIFRASLDTGEVLQQAELPQPYNRGQHYGYRGWSLDGSSFVVPERLDKSMTTLAGKDFSLIDKTDTSQIQLSKGAFDLTGATNFSFFSDGKSFAFVASIGGDLIPVRASIDGPNIKVLEGESLGTFKGRRQGASVIVSNDGHDVIGIRVLENRKRTTVFVLNKELELLGTLKGLPHQTFIGDLVKLPSSEQQDIYRMVIVGSNSGSWAIFELRNGEFETLQQGEFTDIILRQRTRVDHFNGGRPSVHSGAISPDGQLFALAWFNGQSTRVYVARVNNGAIIAEMPLDAPATFLRFSLDGSYLIGGLTGNKIVDGLNRGQRVRVWDYSQFSGSSPRDGYRQ